MIVIVSEKVWPVVLGVLSAADDALAGVGISCRHIGWVAEDLLSVSVVWICHPWYLITGSDVT